MIKAVLKSSVAATALLLAACGNGEQSNDTPANEQVVAKAEVKPELGSFGVDLTAQKESVKPGDNFFEYMNGTWLDTFELPADRTNYGAFTVLAERSRDRTKAIIDEVTAGDFPQGSVEQKIGDYYNSYMDVEAINARGIEPLRPLLDEIAAVEDVAGLIRMFGRDAKDSMISPVSGGLGIDRENPDYYILNLGLGGLGLPDRDYYLDDSERFLGIREAYKAHIAEMLGFAGVSAEDAASQAETILALETKLAEKQWERADRRDRTKNFNPTTMEELKANYTGFDWDAFFGAGGLEGLKKVNVTGPQPLKDAIALVNEVPVADWKAYLAYHTISNHAAILSEEIDTANFNFFGKTLRGQQEQQDRWKRATARVGALDALGEAIGQVYVKRHFPPEAKAEMVKLVENLRTAMGQRIDGLSWMGEETKKEAHAKLASFNPKIGYPDKWKDLSKIDIKDGDLFANAKAIDAFNYEDLLGRFKRKTDKDEWFMTPQTVNAYYNPQFNEIVFPAAILQPPFFDLGADAAVNYGGIGAVIGHEMGHGFDDQGSKSDATGVQRNWWTDDDRAAFEKLTSTLGGQYDQYEPVPGNHVDGTFTMGENIGDLGGLRMAYTAYKLSLNGKEAPVIDGLTGDQRFFMAWAQVWKRKYAEEELLNRLKSDPHSPSEYRVNGIVRNMDEWYEAFDVKEGDALYLAPEDRVQIW
ncbi:MULTISPECIES: M13 family metallopeptidase [Kordiimonas]|jgi:putative endopeptidase|uniref:M13 family metallopeptidase n=1 Tax=Kordiimonas TaxID=288021 RepID=UPI00257B184A|nr:M13-type metalloendopeptidase [Kordiimonas sp. UBA4487]